MNFFIATNPPTMTQQEHRIGKRKDGTTYIYENRELRLVRNEFKVKLSKFKPEAPLEGPLRLIVKWCFPYFGKQHYDGEYKTTRPDTDNLNKMLKDVMTWCGFWKDDAQVASEIIEKFWSLRPGIYIQIDALEKEKT